MKTSKFAFEIIWPLRHTYTPHSQQVRPRSNSQKQPKTVKKKKERAYYRETFFVLHLKISGFILWLFSPSTSSITRVGYSTFLFCSLLMSPLKRKEYIYISVLWRFWIFICQFGISSFSSKWNLKENYYSMWFFFRYENGKHPPTALCAVINYPYFRFCACIYDYDITNHDFLGEIGKICLKIWGLNLLPTPRYN